MGVQCGLEDAKNRQLLRINIVVSIFFSIIPIWGLSENPCLRFYINENQV